MKAAVDFSSMVTHWKDVAEFLYLLETANAWEFAEYTGHQGLLRLQANMMEMSKAILRMVFMQMYWTDVPSIYSLPMAALIHSKDLQRRTHAFELDSWFKESVKKIKPLFQDYIL